MKKVSMLLLLTVVLAFSAFAIEGIGDFEGGVEFGFANALSADDDEALNISIEPTFNYSNAFGIIGLSVTVGDVVYIGTDSDLTDKLGDELYINITPSVALPLGPGEFGFGLGLQANLAIANKYGLVQEDYGFKDPAATVPDYSVGANPYFRIDPVISYGLDAGFGELAFELGTYHLQLTKAYGDKNDAYGLNRLPIYLQAGLDLPFGFGFWLHPVLEIKTQDGDPADTGLAEFDLDIHFAFNEQILAGVEVDIPTVEDGIKEGGITIIPRCELTFGPLGAYVQIEVSNVGTGDTETSDSYGQLVTAPAAKIQIKPIIGVTYSF
jgi:hypothetical protein